ncbi:ATP-binding protein [Dankookia sp. GCM10030260]|uniref:ATP-binding protein n=1 Tax=Dankookia sp. GCM10030260 TaxID=3273390 RepID=UPI00361F5388
MQQQDSSAVEPPAVDPAECEREPIHRLGEVQPHGGLLLLDAGATRILRAAGDLAGCLGQDAAALPGRAAAGILPAALLAALPGVAAGRALPLDPPPLPGFEVLAHRTAEGILLELAAPLGGTPGDPTGPVAAALAELDLAGGNLFRAAQALAHGVAAVAGCQRVVIYRFLPDWSGEVIAERRQPHQAPLLGLRYPPSDVPAQARALYRSNLVRVVIDAQASPAPLHPPGAAPDLGMALLRSAARVHLGYLNNMGVRATLTASLMVEGQLWGMIACHHDAAWLPPAAQRAAVQALATGFAAAVLRAGTEAAAATDRRVAEATAMLDAATAPGLLTRLLLGPAGLAAHAGADGIAWVDATRILGLGLTPPNGWLRAMAAVMAAAPTGTLRAETSLAPLDGVAPGAATGMLAAGLPGAGLLALFRREYVHDVHWGGDPAEPLRRGPDGRLQPRRSFTLTRQTMLGTGRPWDAADHAILAAAVARLAADQAAGPATAEAAWQAVLALADAAGEAPEGLAGLLLPQAGVTLIGGEDAAAPTLAVSAGLARLLGATPHRLVGRPWGEVAQALGIAHGFGAAMQRGQATIEAWSPQDGPVTLWLRQEPALRLQGPGLDRSFAAILVEDETRVVRLTAALATAAKEADLARLTRVAILRNTNHELRTPLNAILGFGELVEGRHIDERDIETLRAYGREIVSAGQHQLAIIENMLDLSMIESSPGARPEEAPYDLAATLREAVEQCRPLLDAAGIHFACLGAEAAMPWRGDARMVRQALVNLLGNAAKFTPPLGEVRCRLRGIGTGAGAVAEITVTDSGPGITPEQQRHLFQAFVQGDHSRTRAHGGLGLGLFISRSFIERQGGTLTLESRLGHGATFRIRLPHPARRQP